jgi:hypothetical protein
MSEAEIKFGSIFVAKGRGSKHVVVDVCLDSGNNFEALELIGGNKDNIAWIAGSADQTYVRELLKEILTVEEIISGIANYNNGISEQYALFLRKASTKIESKFIEIS